MWVALAEAEAELGLPISEAQLNELREHVETVDLESAGRYERQLRHDVMAHVHAYGDQCPTARGIIHLGATSAYVTDNTDLLLIRESLELIRGRLARVIDRLGTFARRYRDLATLGYTHWQPAQATTVGKRACLWAYDLVMDLDEVEHRLSRLKARGVKGTTGTQASFLSIFGGDHGKVRQLEARVAEKLGFGESYPVTGQTYSRRVDSQVLSVLSGIAQSAHKAGLDLRFLQHLHEIEEPFEERQIGSSAMAYKRNPMRAERMCGLARFVTSLDSSAAQTASVQGLERTLDDSANRRLVIPQAFLAVDAILILYQTLAEGAVVHPGVIARHLANELPFMATEAILMAGVAAGGDRQDLHERIRRHSREAARVVQDEGRTNDLLDRLRSDESFRSVNLEEASHPSRFVGRAPEQVDEFLESVVEPIRERLAHLLFGAAEVFV
jgi:adenylosuccinate lyase